MIHPDSPLIDGAIPRTPQERCSILLDYANSLLDKAYRTNTWDTFPSGSYVRFFQLEEEYRNNYEEHDEFFEWHSLEDDIIALVNDVLPEDVVMLLHPDDPGTIVIWDVNDEVDG